ncbi:hypothetical protein [Amycolatopsis magusensis]|uniref:Trypsin-like peptidase domain-containing protein n=1 Tax=Amycolatopsis magusensis TaxID=882444 RepID=A0ABS4PVI2_9PSEU|nr:hypothetical protein [Amycolatopsis magusensis]MBP2182576.1 hypothetical protein [Amycolatopsis magusensis]MDI5980321.1 hypothetical protein [Amycolatopsis magusensis]
MVSTRASRWALVAGVVAAAGLVLAPGAGAQEKVVVTNGLQLDHGAGLTLCTLGPVGTDNAGRLIGITAAHCAGGGDLYYPGKRDLGPIGHYAHVSADQAFHDYAVIEYDPAKVTLSSNGPALRIDRVLEGGLPAVGSNVCKDGRTTGKTCGLVGSNADGLITSFAVNVPGDSGGPLVLARNDGTATEWAGIVTRVALTMPPFVYTSAKNILDDIATRGPDAPGAGFTPVND